MKYEYHVTANYTFNGQIKIYKGTYKTEKSANKRIKDLHKWFENVHNEKITIRQVN